MDKISDSSSEFCKFESYGGKIFFVKMILEPPMYINKSFCIFHLNRKSELQTLCGYRYEIMRYKLSFKVIFLQEGRDILLEKITDAIKEGRFLKENTTS